MTGRLPEKKGVPIMDENTLFMCLPDSPWVVLFFHSLLEMKLVAEIHDDVSTLIMLDFSLSKIILKIVWTPFFCIITEEQKYVPKIYMLESNPEIGQI